MELKVGKDKDVNDIASGKDASDFIDEIRYSREYVAILKEEYEKATTTVEKRVIGQEINNINNEIKSMRDGIREVAFDSSVTAQKLEAEISTLHGELAKYRDIDYGKIEDVMKEFSKRYPELPGVRDEVRSKLEVATGEERRTLQDRYDVINAAILQLEIDIRNEMIQDLLPYAKGINSPEDVAEYAEGAAEGKRKTLYDNSDIKDIMIKIIKYGKPAKVKYVIDDEGNYLVDDEGNYVEEFDKDEKRVIGVLEGNIEERDKSIGSVGGVWTAVGDTDTLIGKNITFTEKELDELAKIRTPDEMVSVINNLCTTNQRKAFSKAMGDIDKSGDIIEKADVVCSVPDNEIYDAFHRMKELEAGVDGSGYEYMRIFLKRMFKYGAFEDDVFDDMSKCRDIDVLLDIIRKEITDCSCVIRDIHEDAVRNAFEDKETIERGHSGKEKSISFMNRAMRNIFNCDTFEDHVYRNMSEYEDPGMLVDKINTELSNAGVYDKDVLEYAIGGVDRKSVLSKSGAETQLDDVFGDHFTKIEYMDAAKHVMSESSLVDNNRSALIKRFRTIGKEGQILAGKTLEGITNDDYNQRWDKERQKMIKHGETKNIEVIMLKRQVDAAQKHFASLVLGIDDESMSSRDEIRYVLEAVGLQPYVIRNLSTSVTDIEYVIDDNIQKLSRGMKALIKKHNMYEEDIFRESRIYDAIEKRARMELGDSKSALAHMKNAILSEVGKLDMTGYGKSIKDAVAEKINTDYGDIDEKSIIGMPEDGITKQFSRRIKRYREDAEASITNTEELAIRDLYAGKPVGDDVYIPPTISMKEMQKEHDKETKETKETKLPVAVGVPEAIEPFIAYEEIGDYTDAIPKKPKKATTAKGKAEMVWWESFMAKNEPIMDRTTAFNNAGLALVMRKGVGKNYVVYGEGGKSVGFKNLNALDRWYKTHYGK